MKVECLGDGIMLYLADCLEVLPALGRVDALITDPPYGIRHIKGSSGRGKHNRRNSVPVIGDDVLFDPAPWLGFTDVILWGADHFAQRLPRGRWLIWDKLDGVESFDSFSDFEVAWFNKVGASRMYRHLWKGICQASGKDEGRHHPTQKPIALMEWCIRFTSGIVLDPFMGSGTTGVACTRLGRRFIGIEIEPSYFEIACRRIDKALRQPDLFVRSPTMKQLPLPIGDVGSDIPSGVKFGHSCSK
jgi:site-specific DNA-methyltransferase (adenine-specific)/modification methylase